MSYYLLFDVGGTNIKAGIFSSDGLPVNHEIEFFDAKSRESKEVILQNFVSIIEHLADKIPMQDRSIIGIAMAFPGPFDYENGISLMKGLNKYDAIHGVILKEELQNLLLNSAYRNLFDGLDENTFPFLFLNDIEAFAIGECHYGKSFVSSKVFYLCIGTGAGSAFTREKKILKNEQKGVPRYGWIYNLPYQGGIIDDYISARGLMMLTREELGTEVSGLHLSEMAAAGDRNALRVFDLFGHNLKEALLPIIESFEPDGIVIGGEISKSAVYFGKELEEECRKKEIRLDYAENTSMRSMQGLFYSIQNYNH